MLRRQRITKVGNHHEYSSGPLPAFVISYETPENTRAYVSVRDGTFQTLRHRDWRWFDFLWMTHTMDYQGRNNFNTLGISSFFPNGTDNRFERVLALVHEFAHHIKNWKESITIKINKMENMKEMNHDKNKGNYSTFLIMLGASFAAMYITMYLNSYEIDQIYFSLTRFYMTCLGIAAMAVIMLLSMLKMYKDKKKNIAIYFGSLVLFIGALVLVRAQKPIIGDVLWMKAMIPHHSIAILTSERANIKDPEVKKLANDIIKAQKIEIEEMKAMIERLENK